MSQPSTKSQANPGGQRFVTTRWSLVRAAGASDADARLSLEALCRTYWYPLYAYIRRRGHGVEDAQDLTQAFIVSLLEHDAIGRAVPEQGRFRSFLLGSLNHFLSDASRRQRAQKRGGHQNVLLLNLQNAEERYRLEPADARTAEDVFERRWALTVLGTALARLEEDYCSSGKAVLFDALRGYLATDASQLPLGAIAESLGMQEGAVKVAAHRLRRRYRESLRSEIMQTVATSEELDDELGRLFRSLGG